MLILAHLGTTHLGWDPAAIAALTVVAWLFLRGPGGRSERRRFFFVGGILMVTAAVASPLETLAEELASAHMGQHILLIMLAGPLLALSRPLDGVMSGLPRSVRKLMGRTRRRARLTPDKRRLVSPVLVWIGYAGSLWAWHAAGLYELALRNGVVHLLAHICFLATAALFWSMVLRGAPRNELSPGLRALMVFTTAFHSVLLAALLTFADTSWYTSYADTAAHWGMSPIDDQRLAGLLMWIPGGLLYTGVGLWIVLRWVRDTGPEGPVSDRTGLTRAR